jgi:tRNA(adenine34) deaminase
MDRRIIDLDEYYMKLAIKEALKAFKKGEVPVGAVLVNNYGKVISRGYNLKESKKDPTAHAEIIAIRKGAKKIENWRLSGFTIYVTLEPCPMCFYAIIQARIKRLVFGALNIKLGIIYNSLNLMPQNIFNKYIEVKGGVLEDECSELIKKFFEEIRHFSVL